MPAFPRTRFTLVRQFNHDDAKTLKAKAIAREADVFGGMDLDSQTLMRRVCETGGAQTGSSTDYWREAS